MARTSRNNMKDSSFFHIMVQGINKEYIFNTSENKKKYLKLLYTNNNDIRNIAYCIMDNHAHVLVHTDVIHNMEIWMKKINTSYAIYYNKINDRVGYVFRNRYKVQPIKNEKHLYSCIEYIHNNPVKANLCKSKEEYEFSSYSKIYQGNQIKIRNEIEEILSQYNTQLDHDEKESVGKFKLIENEKEEKEEICQEIINNFFKDKKIDIGYLKKDKQQLKEIVEILKYENNISYRVMERYLKMSRETLRRLAIK